MAHLDGLDGCAVLADLAHGPEPSLGAQRDRRWHGVGDRHAVEAEPLITALRQLKGIVDFNQSLALQAGAITALREVPDWPRRILPVYRERRDRTRQALSQIGWQVPEPSMALYLWLPVPDWARSKGWDDERMTAALLEQTGLALTPGSGFGAAGRNWMRLALVRNSAELEAAVDRLRPWWQRQC